MTRLGTTTIEKINNLHEEVSALEKKAAFLRNKILILESVALRTETEAKYLVFSGYLTDTRSELETVVEEWAVKTLELNDLSEDAQ